jgi:hypothetical protein
MKLWSRKGKNHKDRHAQNTRDLQLVQARQKELEKRQKALEAMIAADLGPTKKGT